MCLQVFFAKVIFVDKTTKADWLTRYLYRKNFWVGGTKVAFRDNPLTSATQTIRYFLASRSEFLIVYILEFNEPLDQKLDYESAINFFLSELQITPNFTLAIWPNQTHTFAILEGADYRQNLDTKSVLLTFEQFDPALIGRSSYLKPLNRSFTDFFHLWARQNLKGFQNDIDAFIKHDGNLHMLELKRPKEDAYTWKPYGADTRNYQEYANLCSRLKSQLTNIAYTAAEPGKMKIFKDVTFNNQKLEYVTANVEINPEEEILIVIKRLDFQNEVSER
jgi:hypothetical protein